MFVTEFGEKLDVFFVQFTTFISEINCLCDNEFVKHIQVENICTTTIKQS